MKQMRVVLVSVLVVLAMGMVMSCGGGKKVPDWMKDSKIVLSDFLYGKSTTIGEIIGNISEDTKVSFSKSGDKLKMECRRKSNDMDVKLDVTFVCNKKDGTCYVSEVNLEIPASAQKSSAKCKGPNDQRKYGQCLGMLEEAMNSSALGFGKK